RGDVEVGGLDVRDREQRKRREFRHIERLEISAAALAHFDAAVDALRVRRGGGKRFAAFTAVDARKSGRLPAGGAEGTAERAMAGGHLGHGGPRAASRTVSAIPAVECRL